MAPAPKTVPFAADPSASGSDPERARAEVAAVLRRARKVILTSHERTDADGAGSALGIMHGLRALGIEAHAAFPSPLPDNLRFLPGAAEAPVVGPEAPFPPELLGADCVLSLDSGTAARIGGLLRLAEVAPEFLNVDHHVSNEGFGTRRWVDASYAATGVMAFELLCEIGAPLSREVCLCLYTALVFDTGGFAFSNTDPRSHRMAAACIDRGVRPHEVTAAMHRSRSLASWKFTGDALDRLRMSDDGAVAWITVTRELMDRHALGEGRMPELIDIPVSLAATRIGFQLTELDGGKGVRVSLRSRCALGVHVLASRHGGGGHARAAGMTLPGNVADAEKTVLADARRALDEWAAKHKGALPPLDA